MYISLHELFTAIHSCVSLPQMPPKQLKTFSKFPSWSSLKKVMFEYISLCINLYY